MNVSRSWSLLTAFCDVGKEEIYVAAVMGWPDLEKVSKEVDGWKVKGDDEEGVRLEVARRFSESKVQPVREIVEGVKEWFLFPVFSLGMSGKWWRGRVICVGDAAHAVSITFLYIHLLVLFGSVETFRLTADTTPVFAQMPPQGQSVGICLDDVILFSRLLAKHKPASTSDIATLFTRYDSIRRPIVTEAHKQAVRRWENVKDISWLVFKIREWVVWLALLLFANWFFQGAEYDVLKEEL